MCRFAPRLRNFVEYIVQKVYSGGVDTDPNDYQDKKAAWEFVKTQGQLRFLSKFHGLAAEEAAKQHTLLLKEKARLVALNR